MNRRTIIGVSICSVLLLSAVFIVGSWRGMSLPTSRPVAPPRVGQRADRDHLPVVYASDFEHGAGDAWSTSPTDQTPNGQNFLGPFDNRTVGLTITALPAHNRVRVSFDFYAMQIWDGSGRISINGRPSGPDFFEVGVHGGPNLLRATFSTLPDDPGFAASGKLQTYPSPIPSSPNAMGTGGNAKNPLGYIFEFSPKISFPLNATYSMVFTFPHTEDSIDLDFDSYGKRLMALESWGLANVKVEALTVDDAAPVDAAEIGKLWASVLGEDPIAAHDAYWKMIALGDASAKFLDQTAAGFGVDQAEAEANLTALRTSLKDEAPLAKLVAIGPPVEPALRACVKRDPALQKAMDLALREIEVTPIDSPMARKAAAASRILGVINTPLALSIQARLTAAPRPQLAEGSPEYAAEWMTRFDDKYQLRPSEKVRYIPRPLPVERAAYADAYLKRFAELYHRPYSVRPSNSYADMAMIIRTAGWIGTDADVSFRPRSSSPNNPIPTGLARYVDLLQAQGVGVTNSEKVVIGPAFENIDLPGDWVIRENQTQAGRLKELARIASEQTGRKIYFEERADSEEVLVVRGGYAFKPLPDMPVGEAVIHVTADKPAENPTHVPPYEMGLGSLFTNISGDLGRGIVQEFDPKSRGERVKWQIHPSAMLIDQPNKQFAPGQMDRILKNLADQTSLTYTLEQRPIKTMVAVE